jgi:hypothetical protein
MRSTASLANATYTGGFSVGAHVEVAPVRFEAGGGFVASFNFGSGDYAYGNFTTTAPGSATAPQLSAGVTPHSNHGRATLILQRFPLFKCKAIALKSRTLVVKPRTKSAAKIVRDLSAKVATIRDSGRGRLERKPLGTLPSDTGPMRFPLPSTLSAF